MAAAATTPKRFEELREEKGWTPIDGARRVGWVSKSDLAEWEAGSLLWEAPGLPDLAKAFGVPLSGVARPPNHRFVALLGHPFAVEARGLDDKGWTAEVAAHFAGDTASTAVGSPEGLSPFRAKTTGRTADEACDARAAEIDARPAGG